MTISAQVPSNRQVMRTCGEVERFEYLQNDNGFEEDKVERRVRCFV